MLIGGSGCLFLEPSVKVSDIREDIGKQEAVMVRARQSATSMQQK
jgi:hypothetical protein